MSDRILLCRNGYGHHLPLALHPLDISHGVRRPTGVTRIYERQWGVPSEDHFKEHPLKHDSQLLGRGVHAWRDRRGTERE